MKKGKPGSRQKAKSSKGKKWKKGQSCVTNPSAKDHRKAAKNRFFNYNTGPSDLTVDALAKHDAGQSERDGMSMQSDAASDSHTIGGKTFATWATNWTDCTNATFSRVLRYANSAMHKEILAVLAAITEIIKTRGGKETETEYFAALMTALESMDGEETLAAISYLLSLAIKRVPPSVLKSRFSDVTKLLVETLGKHADSSTPALLRSLLRSLAHVLRVQDQTVWNSASTMHVYNSLLAFVIHSKPKVRRAAQEAVRAVLRGSVFMTQDDAPPHHPAASATAKYCIHQIQACGGVGEATTTLHILGLLKEILACFPQHSIKSCCETVLRLMTLSNVLITSVCMKTLHGLFLAKPKASSLSPELNAQIITALYDYQPSETDVQPMLAWLVVMEQAHVNLARVNGRLCVSHLPRIATAAMRCVQCEKREMPDAASKTLVTLLRECVAPSIELLVTELQQAPPGGSTVVHKIIHILEAGLSYQFHAAWDLVIGVLTVMFEVMGKQFGSLMSKCLVSLADLRDSHRFPYKTELDKCVGMAVKTMGPKAVLAAVPLQITGEGDDYNFPRSWLLPVIRDNVQDTELGYFKSYFLPLAAKLRQKSQESGAIGQAIVARTYDVLQSQIWSLLPGFCTRPTDLCTSFKGVAKILGSALTEREDIRMDVLASIRKLIYQNLDNEDNKAELARFAKNFLPLMFNIFTTETDRGERDGVRLAVLETIKCYLQISPLPLTESFINMCLEKFQDANLSIFRRHALLDLTIAMVMYANEERLKEVFSVALSQLSTTDKTIQKKSYRILEEICRGSSAATKNFVSHHLGELQHCLLQSLAASSPSSKAPRLRCLILLFHSLEAPQPDFVSAVLPEAVLCTRETAEKARVAAFALLVEMGRAVIRWNTESEKSAQESVCEFVEAMLGGLAGEQHQVSCTVLALTKVLYEFKEHLNTGVLKTMVEANCLLLQSKSREIVKSALGLTKTLLTVVDHNIMAQFLRQIVSSLVVMKEDNKHHVRFRPKEIFSKLIRKFGYEVILSMVSASHHKMLSNIRKTQERQKKRKQQESSVNQEGDEEEEGESEAHHQKPETIDELLRDTDSELDDDDDDQGRKRQKKAAEIKKAQKQKKPTAAWLKEGGDDIMDFLDPSVSKKVLATKPVRGSDGVSPGVKHNFKTASDGRLIITEDDSDDEKSKKQRKGDKKAPIDDIDELLDAMQGPGKKSRKRKLSTEVEEEDVEDKPMKYQAGGRGIHRPINKSVETLQEPGAEYRAKKAKGDMKRKGKPDPFAYVPLDIKGLNRRKQAKNAGRFKNLVKGARKGAAKGAKQKGKKK